MINITGKRFWFFVISLVFILVSLLSLFTFGLKTGIEFTSGSMLTIDFEQKVEQPHLTAELTKIGRAHV